MGVKNTQIYALLSTVTTIEDTIINTKYKMEDGENNWYSATWRTAAYDFKTKKFKCTKVEYSMDTGYISKMYFEEL